MRILQTIDLKKYYGVKPNITRALDGVNFSVEQGEFVVYMQPKVDIQQGDAIGGAEALVRWARWEPLAAANPRCFT